MACDMHVLLCMLFRVRRIVMCFFITAVRVIKYFQTNKKKNVNLNNSTERMTKYKIAIEFLVKSILWGY